MNTLTVSHLSKKFHLSRKQQENSKSATPYVIAADDISFSLQPGEIYGLLGPNGAGKTTTLRIISSLIKPDKGQVLYQGADVRKDINAYRQKVGFLTSELRLDDFFTPDYTFTYMARLYGMKEAEIAEKKTYLFDKFGVSKFKDVKIHDLSTGMKQKTSLAIALCHDPDIIVFDEPTNGLDIVASKEVEDFLLDLKAQGKTILISTHIFSLVEKLCDKVGIIIHGQLRLEGDLKQLTAAKPLEEVFFDLYGKESDDEQH